jgi:hypothetical protein
MIRIAQAIVGVVVLAIALATWTNWDGTSPFWNGTFGGQTDAQWRQTLATHSTLVMHDLFAMNNDCSGNQMSHACYVDAKYLAKDGRAVLNDTKNSTAKPGWESTVKQLKANFRSIVYAADTMVAGYETNDLTMEHAGLFLLNSIQPPSIDWSKLR